MNDWNSVASVRGREFSRAVRFLEQWGTVGRTDYYNVVVLRVGDPLGFLEGLRARIEERPGIRDFLARLVPVLHAFPYRDREEFEREAEQVALGWAAELAGRAFHVRMHRRGFRSRLSSQEEEQRLSEVVMAELEKRGAPGRIDFESPDAILAVETVGPRAGLSLWSRAQLDRYPILGLD